MVTTAQLGALLDIQLDALQPAAQLPAEEDRTGSAGWFCCARDCCARYVEHGPSYPALVASPRIQSSSPLQRTIPARDIRTQKKNCEIHTVVCEQLHLINPKKISREKVCVRKIRNVRRNCRCLCCNARIGTKTTSNAPL